MATKLTTVKPPKRPVWPPNTGLVQLGAPEDGYRATQEVFLDGESVGRIVTIEHFAPRRKVNGVRMGSYLQGRRVWKYWTDLDGQESRTECLTRNEAIGGALRAHAARAAQLQQRQWKSDMSLSAVSFSYEPGPPPTSSTRN